MHRALFGGLWIGLLVVSPASAALIIDVGNTNVLPAPGQIVQIFATGFVPGTDPLVTGFNLRAQLGDGAMGGLDNNPYFQSIDFTGGIWDAYPKNVWGGPVPGAEYWADAGVAFTNPGDEVAPVGLIAKLIIDTTGFAPGTVFDLKLADTPLGDSDFGGPSPPVIINGTINLVPEPAAIVQLFGLMAAMGPWFWLRKRNR